MEVRQVLELCGRGILGRRGSSTAAVRRTRAETLSERAMVPESTTRRISCAIEGVEAVADPNGSPTLRPGIRGGRASGAAAARQLLPGLFDSLDETLSARKRIGLVAHDNMKRDLAEWAVYTLVSP